MSDVFLISHVAQLLFVDALENANGGGVMVLGGGDVSSTLLSLQNLVQYDKISN